MALHALSRKLFDMSYVDGGCVGDPPLGTDGSGTSYDNTMGCYLTNYAILGIGVLGVVLMMMHKDAGPVYKAFAVVFYMFTGAGYGLAGYLHQTTTSQEINDFVGVGSKSLSIALSNVGTFGLVLIGVQLLIDKCSISCGWLLYSLAAIINGSAIVYIFLALDKSYFLVSGAKHIAGCIFVFVVYCCRCNFPQAICVIIIALGFIVQGALAPTCGDGGYPDCWKDCILPAPQFNHNALFHVMVAIGMLGLLVLMNASPDMTAEKEKGYEGPLADQE